MPKQPRFIAEQVGYDAPVKQGGYYRVLVDLLPGESPASLAPFYLDYCCIPQAAPSGRLVQQLHALADAATVEEMRKLGRGVQILADADSESKEAIRSLGSADRDRFSGGAQGPALVGRLI